MLSHYYVMAFFMNVFDTIPTNKNRLISANIRRFRIPYLVFFCSVAIHFKHNKRTYYDKDGNELGGR